MKGFRFQQKAVIAKARFKKKTHIAEKKINKIHIFNCILKTIFFLIQRKIAEILKLRFFTKVIK